MPSVPVRRSNWLSLTTRSCGSATLLIILEFVTFRRQELRDRIGAVGDAGQRAFAHSRGGVHGGYGAKDTASRFRHRLSEAVGRVAHAGLDLSHLGC
jgi:hypothetical protein